MEVKSIPMAKILIIDDEVAILDSVTTMLERKNFSVSSILNWENISGYINTFPPDLILLDVSFNGQDVKAICKELKTNTSTKKIPLILFSGNYGVERIAHNYVADGFIPKPFKTSNLLSIIESVKQVLN